MDIHRHTFLLVLSEFKKNVKKFEFLPPLPKSDGRGLAELLLLLVTPSCLTLCDPIDYIAHQDPLSMEFPRQESWSELPFPSPGKPRSPHCRQALYCLSHREDLSFRVFWEAGENHIKPRCFDSIHTALPALREDPPQVTITASRSLSKFIRTPQLAGGCVELEAGYCYFHLRTNKLRQRQHTPATNQPTNSICYLISCKQLTPENKFKGGGMGLGVPPWHTGWQ